MGGAPGALGGMGAMPPGTGGDDMRMNADLFGGGDAVVKYVLEGHDRGVNWASFHPSLPLIVSGADDRQVKLWRMNDTKAWEVDTLRGHMNNVSCVMFHARQDLIVSNSEDKTIRVWDMSKRTGVQTLRREHDRFWILAVHPEVNLLAAGHDTGMLVFKLERERPVYSYVPGAGRLLYVKDRYLRQLDLARQDDVPMLLVRRGSQGLGQGFRSMSFNPAENLALLQSDADGGTYELVQVPKDASRTESLSDGLRSQGRSAVFVARNRFAVLDPGSNSILVKNLQNETTKRVPSPCGKTEAIHYGGTGTILVKGDDKVVLFDIQQRLVVAEAAVPGVKYVVWSDNLDRVALLSKHSVTIADRKLGNLLTAHETMRVKSAAWCRSGVLLYATLNHLKYCLPNGDCGTVQTLPTPVYLTRVEGNVVHCLDRECRARALRVDDGDYRFKLALLRRDFNEVVALIKANRLCGQAIIAYLQQRGFPEVALHFVEDAKVCFTLAVQCGNVEVALRAAAEVDAPETWYQLGVEALRQGNFEIVEFCYQKTHNFERLTFLYLITGELEKLEKMMKIAEMKGRVMDWFHSALYLGDVRERLRILQAAGQLHLAAAAAKAHGLDREGASKTEEEHDRLASLMARVGEAPGDLPQGSGDAKLLMPPCPVSRGGNWPRGRGRAWGRAGGLWRRRSRRRRLGHGGGRRRAGRRLGRGRRREHARSVGGRRRLRGRRGRGRWLGDGGRRPGAARGVGARGCGCCRGGGRGALRAPSPGRAAGAEMGGRGAGARGAPGRRGLRGGGPAHESPDGRLPARRPRAALSGPRQRVPGVRLDRPGPARAVGRARGRARVSGRGLSAPGRRHHRLPGAAGGHPPGGLPGDHGREVQRGHGGLPGGHARPPDARGPHERGGGRREGDPGHRGGVLRRDARGAGPEGVQGRPRPRGRAGGVLHELQSAAGPHGAGPAAGHAHLCEAQEPEDGRTFRQAPPGARPGPQGPATGPAGAFRVRAGPAGRRRAGFRPAEPLRRMRRHAASHLPGELECDLRVLRGPRRPGAAGQTLPSLQPGQVRRAVQRAPRVALPDEEGEEVHPQRQAVRLMRCEGA